MIAQHENKVMASFMLYVDHKVCSKGQAFDNYASFFNETRQEYSSIYGYGAPFRQLVMDESIAGSPKIITGAYLDGDPIYLGTSGFHSISHNKGHLYFTQQYTGQNRLSGNYSVKEYNIHLTNNTEAEILFETKHHLVPKITENAKPLDPDTKTFPAIFIKSVNSNNVPFSFGGADNTIMDVRCVILSDSSFSLDAVCSILRDLNKTTVPFVQDDLPLNSLGAYTGKAFNYTGIATGDGPWIDTVDISQNLGVDKYGEMRSEVYAAFADFRLFDVRKPRE
jgi:hypothetical protein